MVDDTAHTMIALAGPRHDGTDLTFSNRDDDGNPTAFWTVRLTHTETGKWQFKVNTWQELHASEAIYDAENDARQAGHAWLIDYVTYKRDNR